MLSIDDDAARRFYEIEAADNGWSVRELKRQLDSSLYERLALSRDKRAIRRLAREGQIVEKASDLIKDPLVLDKAIPCFGRVLKADRCEHRQEGRRVGH